MAPPRPFIESRFSPAGFILIVWRETPMLHATNLTKRYNGFTALDALNLRVDPGEIFCLLGANGAGKTTTINLFLNFIEPTSGTAAINGLDVVRYSLETKKRVGVRLRAVRADRHIRTVAARILASPPPRVPCAPPVASRPV
jgi:ABC-type Mn2+/Zn2+ transport system ATPase subunit